MTKLNFLLSLHDRLSDLPQEDVEERLNFYSEMIEDRMEEGLSEEEAVSAIGSIDEIAAQIVADAPASKITMAITRPKRRLKAWEIVLLALGSPVWLSLLIAAVAVLLALYVSLWSVIVALWAAFASVGGCALGGVAAGIGFVVGGNGLTGVAMIGAGVVCAGLWIFLFYGCKAATEGAVWLTKRIASGIKRCFEKKEGA